MEKEYILALITAPSMESGDMIAKNSPGEKTGCLCKSCDPSDDTFFLAR